MNTSISNEIIIALRKIIQAVDQNSKSLVKRVGLTGPQLVILRAIAEFGGANVGEIARKVSLSQATATGILERLEKRGLIQRQKSSLDRRRVWVSITDTGEEVINKAPPIMQEAFVERFDQLADWEQHMILSAMQRMVSIMDARGINVAPILTAESMPPPDGDTDGV